MNIPFHVSLMSKFIEIPKYEGNEAQGEIVRMHFKNSDNHDFNYQVVGTKDGYSWIWRHIAHNYWKVVSKVKEGPFSCQP